MEKSIFSVDVEDWFHILDVPGTPGIEEWPSLPSRVEKNFTRLLDIFDEEKVTVTCFFLGWIAQHFPHLVRDAAGRGHEVASHGFAHRLVYQQNRDEFLGDVRRARLLLEDIAGVPVSGYRAPGFSTTEETPWFFDALAEAGYEYDSSVFPASRGHGGIRTARRDPHRVGKDDSLIEMPITVADLLGRAMCFFGGGYLRLSPYWLIHRQAMKVLKEGRPVVFYIHPREIDPSHPRLAMNRKRQFKSYVNLDSTEVKIRRIFHDFPVTTFRNAISSQQGLAKSYVA